MSPRGAVYKLKGIGPSTDPCRTPLVSAILLEIDVFPSSLSITTH